MCEKPLFESLSVFQRIHGSLKTALAGVIALFGVFGGFDYGRVVGPQL